MQSKRLLYQSEYTTASFKIWEDEDYRWLTIGDSNNFQSKIFKKSPSKLVLSYLTPMLSSLTFAKNLDNILMLGLGGGAILHYLNEYHPKCKVTVIEYNSELIEAASELFYFNQLNISFTIICADAFNYLTEEKTKYDAVLVDVGEINSQQYENIFLHMGKAAQERTVCVINSLCFNQVDAKSVLLSVNEYFMFRCLAVPVSGTMNLILVISNKDDFIPQIDQYTAQKKLKLDSSPVTKYGLIGQFLS